MFRIIYRIAAYIVDYGPRLEHHTVFLDRERAHQYAANSHGVFEPLFRREEVPDELFTEDDT